MNMGYTKETPDVLCVFAPSACCDDIPAACPAPSPVFPFHRPDEQSRFCEACIVLRRKTFGEVGRATGRLRSVPQSSVVWEETEIY